MKFTKKAGLLIAGILGVNALHAQQFEWAFDTKQPMITESLTKDDHDNVYGVGNYYANMTIAGRTNSAPLTHAGGYDAYLVKYDREGDIVWTRSISAPGNEFLRTVHYDGAGSIYMVGYFSGTVTFGPGYTLTSAGSVDAMVIKYDTSGVFKWAANAGGPRDDEAFDVSTDGAGNVVVCGKFFNKADFNPSPLPQDTFFMTPAKPTGLQGGFVLKLTAGGEFIWAKQFLSEGGEGHTGVGRIAADASGNIFASGNWSKGRLDINPGVSAADTFMLPAARNWDVFIVKLDASGNFVNGGSYGGVNQDDPPFLKLDESGNLYATGAFHDDVDFNLSPLPADTFFLRSLWNEKDAYVWAMDNNLGFRWAAQIAGGFYTNTGHHIAFDHVGNLFVTGTFRGVDKDFDPGPDTFKLSTNGGMGMDVFFLSLTPEGKFKWAGSLYGTTSQDASPGFMPLSNGDLLGFGRTNGRTDLDPGTDTFYLNTDVETVYMLKLTYRNSTYDTLAGCDSVSANGTWYYASGDYVQQFQNRDGLDSLLYLHVTVNQTSAPQNITRSACDSFTLDGAEYYYSSGTYEVRFTNAAGCDSLIQLHLTVYRTDTVLQITSCGSYTLNGETYTETGDYVQTLSGSGGCDSTIRLELEIIGLPGTGVIRSGNVLTAAQGGADYQWIYCDTRQPVDAASEQTFIPQLNGSYAVVVTRNGCTDTSECIEVTDASSVGGMEAGTQMRIYPNPSDGIFIVQGLDITGTIIVTDVQGREVWAGASSKGDREIRIDLIAQPSGMYLLQFANSSGTKFRAPLIKK